MHKDNLVHFILDGKVFYSMYMITPPREADEVDIEGDDKRYEVTRVTWMLGTAKPGKAQIVYVIVEYNGLCKTQD